MELIESQRTIEYVVEDGYHHIDPTRKALGENMLFVTLYTGGADDEGWSELCFNKELALQVARRMIELAEAM